MFTKFQKLTSLFIMLLLVLTFACSCQPNAKAQPKDFNLRAPSFALYCEDKTIIDSVSVNLDLHEDDAVKKGKGIIRTDYKVKNTNSTVEFAIPFFSSPLSMPPFSVFANGKEVIGSIIYGKTCFVFDDTDFDSLIKDLSVPDMSDLIGTLYTIIPTVDTLDIKLTFPEEEINSFIYDNSNHFSSSFSADGKFMWTLKNALSKNNYTFFVLGSDEKHSFSSNCEFQKSTMTCKEFIIQQYELLNEYYSQYNIPMDFFLTLFNRILQEKSFIKYDELFFDSITPTRFNAYKFSLPINEETTISYELPIAIQRNSTFKPAIYLFEQKNLNNYLINYNIELNNATPYIIESSTKVQNNGTHYTTETTDSFYFIFSESKKPKQIADEKNNRKKIVLTACITLCFITLIGTIVCIVVSLHNRKSKK